MTARSHKWWQWETLLVTMGGYALYYVIRKNLSIAMPLLGEIGVSKVQLGAFLTAGGIVYGVGRFLNGIDALELHRAVYSEPIWKNSIVFKPRIMPRVLRRVASCASQKCRSFLWNRIALCKCDVL